MALSQADFYAFSKATGSPYVEDPESQAQIAPQVAEWRRNQLKSPETKQAESSSLLNALGIGAAVAGAGALLAAGLGRRGGVRMGNAQQAARQAAQQVNVEDFGNVYRAAGRPAPSKPAPTPTPTPAATPRPAGSRQGGVKFADLGQITGTEPKGFLRGRQPGADITPAAPRGALTSLEITEVPVVDITEAAEQPRLGGAKDFIAGYFQKTGTPAGYLTGARRQIPADSQIVAVQAEKPASLVDRQNAIESLVPDQTFNALDAAEDQMTGRVKQQLQRNEDLDMSQIDLMEEMAEYSRLQGMEQDEPINRVASQLPDGLPADQAEGIDLRTGERFAIKRNVLQSYPKSTLGSTGLVPGQRIQMEEVSQGIPDTSSAQRYLNTVRDEIASQLGEQGLSITPERIEEELANRFGKEAWKYGPKQTARRQALELYAQTGDPRLLENIRPQTIQFGSIGELPVSEFKKEVVMPETAIRAEERYQGQVEKAKDWLGNLRVQLEPQRNKILQERREIVEQNAAQLMPQLESARAKGQVGLVRQIENQLNNMRQLWRNPELGTHRQDEYRMLTAQIEGAQRKINESIAGIQKQLPTTLADWSGEGMVVKPKLTSAPEFEIEDDVLSTVEGLGTRPAEVVEGQLTYVPGGLMTGGRAKAVPNVGLVDEETGEPISMQAASRTSIRGAGSMESYGGEMLSAKDIYGIQRAYAGASPTSPEAAIPPSASPSAYRLPAGSRAQGKQAINVVVAGGREYENYPELSQKLDQVISQLNIPPGMKVNIVSGGARGADTLAEKYAQERGLGLQVFKADWEGQGLSAGMNRNRQMAEVGDVLVAFPGGTGTENMVQQMTQDFGKPAYRAADIATVTPEQKQIAKQSLAASELIRRANIEGLNFKLPTRQGPSMSLRGEAMPRIQQFEAERPQFVEVEDAAPKVSQLGFPSNVVPSTAAAARVRTTPADVAAQQLGNYLAKLQRGRSTPLTSAAVIQPKLF